MEAEKTAAAAKAIADKEAAKARADAEKAAAKAKAAEKQAGGKTYLCTVRTFSGGKLWSPGEVRIAEEPLPDAYWKII